MLELTIQKAIKSAVAKKEQPEELATKIISWMEKLTEGDEEITDKSQYVRRCQICLDTIQVKTEDGENINE
jgi:hypothetical protein